MTERNSKPTKPLTTEQQDLIQRFSNLQDRLNLLSFYGRGGAGYD